ncbi:sugar ABC transporter permease [Microbacterium marmarense]|uniref:Sugar ABC transporter permease n=1 Tax=Microbacterium marmarense TaxID=3122051 RepID=A0ABU8LS29_9MICO
MSAQTSIDTKTPTDRDDTPQKTKKTKRSARTRAEARLGWMLAGPAFGIMLLVTMYPIIQAFYDSLFSLRLTAPDDREFIWFRNYAVVLTDPAFWESMWITLFITVVTVILELLLGFALALVMHRAAKKLRGLARTAILVPYGIVTVVAAFAWFYAFDVNSGFVNSWLAWIPGYNDELNWFAYQGTSLFVIILSEVWKTTPFISLLLLSGLAQVPGDLEEAAKVDGATGWEVMRRVILPNMKAAIMVAVLFRTLEAFRIFDNIYVMTAGANGTEALSLLAYNTSIGRLEIGLGSAISVLLFLSVLIIAAIFIRGFKVDLTGGRNS